MALPDMLAEIAVSAVADKTGKPLKQAAIAKEIAAKIADDPAMKNELNMESLWRSRTATGSTIAAIGVLLPYILPLIGIEASSEEAMEILQAGVTIFGALYAFAGRAFTWSRPMWSRLLRMLGRE